MEFSYLEWFAGATFVALLALNAVLGWRARSARRRGGGPEHSEWPEAIEVTGEQPEVRRAR